MSALDESEFTCYDNRSCRYEDMIAQLRSDLQASQERIARIDADNRTLISEYKTLEDRYAEQARQLDAAREALLAWHVVELNECGEDVFPLMKQLDEIDLYESGDDFLPWAQELRRAWLAANPAPQESQP